MNRNEVRIVWAISVVILLASFSVAFCTTAILQNSSASPPSDSSNGTDNNAGEYLAASNQNIVFADIYIIQALRDLSDGNKTGALNHLSLAESQLGKATNQSQGC